MRGKNISLIHFLSCHKATTILSKEKMVSLGECTTKLQYTECPVK